MLRLSAESESLYFPIPALIIAEAVLRNLKNLLKIIILTLILTSCKNEVEKKTEFKTSKNQPKNSTEIIENNQAEEQIETEKRLKSKLTDLKSNCLNFNHLWAEFENSDYSDKLIDPETEKWIFGLEKKDSLQFERADLISPKCKVFENNHIVSIAFVDLYDYKTALHLFTFKKPEFKPISSFVFYQVGGDGEDFWNINPIKIGDLKYRIKEESGYDNNAIKENEFLIEFRETREYSIDSISGKITKRILKTEKNIIENRK
ncbi:hypothetical protein FNB79_12195 [Formosa sediminum]|uniref:Uncharacterized protein n=1 Tax=Formosa sediminum TaxID=2594004 RepID=A0A516GT53_9FLAO|nr:hypothetical protein [Formosa sediminum]QDO94688.1 hypothetical protein FNB79_12195 [Formosa sediminum]